MRTAFQLGVVDNAESRTALSLRHNCLKSFVWLSYTPFVFLSFPFSSQFFLFAFYGAGRCLCRVFYIFTSWKIGTPAGEAGQPFTTMTSFRKLKAVSTCKLYGSMHGLYLLSAWFVDIANWSWWLDGLVKRSEVRPFKL